MRYFRFVLILVSVCLGQLVCAGSSERIALVVGNSNYKTSPLENPQHDAVGMANLLTKAGFQVDRQLDTDLGQLQAAVTKFGQAIKDPNVKFGLFYYAGHGLQQDWRNYLVPVSANIRTSSDVPKQTVDVSQLLYYMEHAQGRSFLIILDACRDDPFAGTFKPPAKGLSQFDAPVGSLLAYATAPGNVAQDGTGSNGLYTGFLLKEFAVPGTRIEDAFKRVRLNVRMASKGQQIPWESTSLEDDLYLFPHQHRKLTDAEKDLLLEKEMSSWLRVKNSTDPEVLAGFIREFPSGSASELAASRMNRMLASMAAREHQRLATAAQSAAASALELAALEDAARRRAAEAEAKRLAALRAEEERIKLAQAQAAREEAQRQQLAKDAAEREELARLAAEKQRLAQIEAQRLAVAQEEAAKLALQKAQAARIEQANRLEAERQEALRFAEAQAQAARLSQAQAEAARQQASADAAARAEQARAAADKARLAELETQRLALAQQESQKQAIAKLEADRIAALAKLEAERQQAALAAAAQEELAQQARAKALAAQAELQRAQAMKAQREAMEKAEADRVQREGLQLAQLAEQQQREAAQLAAQKAALQSDSSAGTAPVVLPSTPFYKGYAEHQRSYQVGDEYTLQVIDQFKKAAIPLVMKVTLVDLAAERVEYNNGEFVSDLMGNTTTNQRGVFSTPRQFYPADLFIGKKWTTRFIQSRPNNVKYTFEYKLKVVAKETITVPAGTFEAFKIEARGFNMGLGAYLERNIWVAPGINADIAHEIKVRLRNGMTEQNDRQELVSITTRR